LKYQIDKIDKIDPILFENVSKLRLEYAFKYGHSIPIEEIDHFELQFIILAI